MLTRKDLLCITSILTQLLFAGEVYDVDVVTVSGINEIDQINELPIDKLGIGRYVTVSRVD